MYLASAIFLTNDEHKVKYRQFFKHGYLRVLAKSTTEEGIELLSLGKSARKYMPPSLPWSHLL